MTNVAALLQRNPQVHDWRIIEKATKSYELFFVHQRLETVRATDTVDTSVTVYVEHDGAKGDSTFSVYASMTEADVESKIKAAVSRALLVSNQPYALPAGSELAAELPTNMKDADPQILGRQIADAVFAADTVEGGSINACEIFLYRDTLRVTNSQGINKTQVTHRVMIEAIPTFTSGQDSVELYEDYRFTEFDPNRITAEISRRMLEARDRFQAKKPRTPMEVNVVLRPFEIQQLIMEYAMSDLNYSVVYSHGNLHQIGDSLQKDRTGDPLTVTMKGILPGSECSAHFDEDGLALTDTRIIEMGTVKQFFGASRFGQYLGVTNPSGSLRCVQVEPGTLTEEEIGQAPYLECASLSGLQVDLYQDYIGGEIRLAYYVDGEKRTPVTGISMSAKLSDVLSSMRLSRKTALEGAYEGPDKLLMKSVSVL